MELTRCHLTPLDHLDTLVVRGEDAHHFLQGQLSCDLHMLSGTQTLLGAHCDIKGKVQSLFRLQLWQNQILLTTERAMIAASLKYLSRFILRSKVSIELLNPMFKRIGLAGIGAMDLLTRTFGLSHLSAGESLQQGEITVICLPGLIPRFELLGPAESLNALTAPWQDELEIGDSSLWHSCDILAKLPWITPATQGRFFAHEMGLYELGAISLNKGCYIGQEIIARVYYKSKPKHHLEFLDLDAEDYTLDPEHHLVLNQDGAKIAELVCSEKYKNVTLCLIIS
jgi:folate-binding protein YgfZ